MKIKIIIILAVLLMSGYSSNAQRRMSSAQINAQIQRNEAAANAKNAQINAVNAAKTAREEMIRREYIRKNPWTVDVEWKRLNTLAEVLLNASLKDNQELRLLNDAGQGNSDRAKWLRIRIDNEAKASVTTAASLRKIEADYKLKSFYKTNK